MFKAANPYDEIVNKATDENLTSENWELNLDICDKVSGEGEAGARNCVASILRRMQHRNANVQLYSLTLCDALSKNSGSVAHRELASRAFTEALRRLLTDRNTHLAVKKKAWQVAKEWNQEWGNGDDGGLLKETMNSLESQNISYDDDPEPAPAEPSSEQLRAEDEELRRVLELSKIDTGGRQAWSGAGAYSSFGAEAASGSSSSAAAGGSGSGSAAPAASSSAGASGVQPNASGYVPSPTASTAAYGAAAALAASAPSNGAPSRGASSSSAAPAATQHFATAAPVNGAPTSAPPAAAAAAPATPAAPSRVRALYDFAPTESGELAFAKGDIIRVLDSVYEHWWRGELKGEAGIFPVNYVEVLPDPTPADLQREAELEARIFAQAGNIDRLLGKLRELDPTRDNLAEDEELQELYQTSLSMRPKIVRLIDRYSVKVAELRAMNEKFVSARSSFDAAMEQSLAKYAPTTAVADYTQQRPEYTQTHSHSQQEYAQQWAQWYAANGYAQPQQGAPQPQQVQAQQPHPNDPAYAQWYYAQQQNQPSQQQVQPQHAPQQQQAPPQQQQYYAQAPQAAAQQQQQVYSPAPQTSAQSYVPAQPQPQGSGSSSSIAPPAGACGSSSALPSPGLPTTPGGAPQDDEKRKLFERAKAEAEAYHRAAALQGAPSAPSGSFQQQQPQQVQQQTPEINIQAATPASTVGPGNSLI